MHRDLRLSRRTDRADRTGRAEDLHADMHRDLRLPRRSALIFPCRRLANASLA
jgi:hypothetical protein